MNLVQQIQQSAVCRSFQIPGSQLLKEGFRVPTLREGEVLSVPYCDNIHAISLDPVVGCDGKQKIADEVARLGFSVREALVFETLGGEVDRDAGEIRVAQRRALAVLRAFEHVASHPGHAMFFSTLSRGGISQALRLIVE